MGGPEQELMGFVTTTTGQWVRCAMNIAHWYAAIMDPRPDLSTPARSLKVSYFWWW